MKHYQGPAYQGKARPKSAHPDWVVRPEKQRYSFKRPDQSDRGGEPDYKPILKPERDFHQPHYDGGHIHGASPKSAYHVALSDNEPFDLAGTQSEMTVPEATGNPLHQPMTQRQSYQPIVEPSTQRAIPNQLTHKQNQDRLDQNVRELAKRLAKPLTSYLLFNQSGEDQS